MQFICYAWVTSGTWKGLKYFGVTIGSIQGKSRFGVAGGESKNSTMAKDRILLYNKITVSK